MIKNILRVIFIICLFVFSLFCITAISSNEKVIKSLDALNLIPRKEPLTELYLDNHELLKGEREDGEYTFSFTIHNLEGKDMVYPYQMYIEYEGNKQVLDNRTAVVKNGEFKTIDEGFILIRPIKRAKLVIELLNKKQSIHFWIESGVPAPTSTI